jgi:hypothetical protein
MAVVYEPPIHPDADSGAHALGMRVDAPVACVQLFEIWCGGGSR